MANTGGSKTPRWERGRLAGEEHGGNRDGGGGGGNSWDVATEMLLYRKES